jgi:cytochrome c
MPSSPERLLVAAALALASPSYAGPGEAIYGRCQACHSFEYHRTGPKHCGLFGRRAGSAEGYEYSSAMKRSGIVWSTRSLDRFLAAPTSVLPGTTMTYAGVPDAKERAALIAYLKARSAAPRCRS